MAEKSPRSYIVHGENIITEAVYQRPIGERPASDSLEGIQHWLMTDARAEASFMRVIDELAWRLLAAGYPLIRVSLHGGTLHPQFRNAAYLWWREPGHTQRIMITYEVSDIVPYEENPVRRVREGGETLRRRLEGADVKLDFAVLRDLQSRGATEYLALPVASSFGFGSYMLAFVTDRVGGLTDREVTHLSNLGEPVAVIADMNSQKQIAENDLFDLQARAIAKHGGEILKFVGDGLLAIFPVADPNEAASAAAEALAAATETLGDLETRNAGEGAASLRMVIALHYGTVTYGNIGSADRLDFTVIGPAVNLVSRAEAVAKSLSLPLVITDDFATVYGRELSSIGQHRFRGLDKEHELFVPASP